MTTTKPRIEFFNVPKPHKYENPPVNLICEACSDVIEHPLHVFSCAHNLCAACWQKSAYNFWGNKNECLVCKTPTELVCYRDYWRFIGKNLFERGVYIETGKSLILDDLIMYCNVEDCDYKAKRADVLLHEKDCWRLARRRKIEAVKEAADTVVEQAAQPAPPCPQLEFAPTTQDPEPGLAPYTQHPKPTLSFQIPSTSTAGSPAGSPARKYIKRK